MPHKTSTTKAKFNGMENAIIQQSDLRWDIGGSEGKTDKLKYKNQFTFASVLVEKFTRASIFIPRIVPCTIRNCSLHATQWLDVSAQHLPRVRKPITMRSTVMQGRGMTH